MESFKANDAASYDAAASDFAYFSALTTKPLAVTIVHLAALRAEDQVLDVATGSGVVALAAAARSVERDRLPASTCPRVCSPLPGKARLGLRQAAGFDWPGRTRRHSRFPMAPSTVCFLFSPYFIFRIRIARSPRCSVF